MINKLVTGILNGPRIKTCLQTLQIYIILVCLAPWLKRSGGKY